MMAHGKALYFRFIKPNLYITPNPVKAQRRASPGPIVQYPDRTIYQWKNGSRRRVYESED